ncbi:MAG: hypothetical protein P4L87_17640 [Formivibrio sp.]|nr:hypothetical protein [Formivibrio sp.]
MNLTPPPEGKPIERDMKRDKPWAWFQKAALEKIRTRCEDAKSTIAVYLALCEIASDEQSSSFVVSMDKIGSKCCLSRRTVFDRLNKLEFIGLVQIARSKTNENFRIPSAYTLLRCESIAQRSEAAAQRCANEDGE